MSHFLTGISSIIWWFAHPQWVTVILFYIKKALVAVKYGVIHRVCPGLVRWAGLEGGMGWGGVWAIRNINLSARQGGSFLASRPTRQNNFFRWSIFSFGLNRILSVFFFQPMLRALFPRYFPSGNNYNPILLLESNTTDTIHYCREDSSSFNASTEYNGAKG